MVSAIQILEEKLDTNRINDICENFAKDCLRILSLRECEISDKGYNSLLKAVGKSEHLLQLSLSLGVVKNAKRIDNLCKALQTNRSLVALFIHGNPLGDEGTIKLCKVLSKHPRIVSLDVGDCDLGDKSLHAICDLLPDNEGKPGLLDLSLSGNSRVSVQAWTKFGLAVAACSTLRELYVDYNKLEDFAASCLLVGLASNRKIQVLDLEGTGITESTAQLILHLIENYPVELRKIILDENNVNDSTKLTINQYIDDNDEGDNDSIKTMDSKADALGTTSRQVDSTRKSKKDSSASDTTSEESEVEEETETSSQQGSSSNSSTLKSQKEDSDIKDTVKTDEDYRVLEQALEEVGQSTGKMSRLSGTLESEKPSGSDDEDGELLTEVPVIATTPVLTMKSNTPTIHTLEDDDSDSGEELHEVYLH